MNIRTSPNEMDTPFFLVRGGESKREEISEAEWAEFVRESKYFESFKQIASAAFWVPDREQYLVHYNGMLVTNTPSQEFIMFLVELAPRFQARLKDFDGNYYTTEVEKNMYQEADEFWNQYSKNTKHARTTGEVDIFLGDDDNKPSLLMVILYMVMGGAGLYLLSQWL